MTFMLPKRPASRRAAVALAACLALLFVLTAAGVLAADGLTPYDVARLQSVGDVAVSPDGGWTAYTLSVPRDPFEDEDGSAWSELWVMPPEGAPRAYVGGEVNVDSIGWTPDGSGIAFLAKREGDEEPSLYVIPRDGGEARRVLAHGTEIEEFSFSPDGDQVAFLAKEKEPEEKEELAEKGFDQEIYEEELRPVKVWIANLEGGAEGEKGAGEPRVLELEGSASELHWSPDGSHLAVALAPTPRIDDALMFRRLRVVAADSGEVVARVENPGKLGDVAWSPDGRRLALLTADNLHDPTAARLAVVEASGGAPRDLLPGFAGDVESIAWKDAESLYLVIHQGVEASLEEIRADGSGRRSLLSPGGPIWSRLSAAGGGVALVGSTPAYPNELFRLADGAAERITDSNPWLEGKQLGRQEVVRYKARDGLDLEGLLIHPVGEEAGKRHPLILVVHGGPEAHYSNGWLTSYSNAGQMGAARGFAVFYPNYRGSTGRGVEFAMSSQGDPAGEEFDDFVDGVDHLIEMGLVDRAKVGITGGSYGGYATAWGATYYSERFAAGVMFVGISEKIAKWGASDIPQELNLVHDRHWPWEAWDLMWERSPVRYVEKARTPLLILHGKNDPRVHPSQSLVLYRYLKVYGQTPVRLVWYPDEGHGNRKAAHRLDYSLRMLRWFGHYLEGPGGEKPPPAVEYERAGAEESEEGEG